MYVHIIVFIFTFIEINGLPVSGNCKTIYDCLLYSPIYDNLKCPYLRTTKLAKPEFLLNCGTLQKTTQIEALTESNSGDLLCLSYYDTFLRLCNSTPNANLFSESEVQNSLKPVVGTDSFDYGRNICSTLRNARNFDESLKPGVEVVLSSFKEELKCIRLCTAIDGSILPICNAIAFMVNATIARVDKKTAAKPVFTEEDFSHKKAEEGIKSGLLTGNVDQRVKYVESHFENGKPKILNDGSNISALAVGNNRQGAESAEAEEMRSSSGAMKPSNKSLISLTAVPAQSGRGLSSPDSLKLPSIQNSLQAASQNISSLNNVSNSVGIGGLPKNTSLQPEFKKSPAQPSIVTDQTVAQQQGKSGSRLETSMPAKEVQSSKNEQFNQTAEIMEKQSERKPTLDIAATENNPNEDSKIPVNPPVVPSESKAVNEFPPLPSISEKEESSLVVTSDKTSLSQNKDTDEAKPEVANVASVADGTSPLDPLQEQLTEPEEEDEEAAMERDGDIVDYNTNIKEGQARSSIEKIKTKTPEISKPLETDEDGASFAANYQNQNIDDSDSYFFSYFMMVCIMFICGYVAYHNKQKILALVVEGRKGRRPSRTRRPNSANYRKLDSNLEEAITSTCTKNATQVIY